MIPESHWPVLREICARLEPEGIVWALTGSTALALQGVPVAVHDIDLQADEEGAHAIERCFADCVTQKVTFSSTDRIRSRYGALAVGGVKVELMGAIEKRLPSGEWEPAPPLAALRRTIEVGGLTLPVLPLEYEYEAYLILGRAEKARIIKEAIERNAADS